MKRFPLSISKTGKRNNGTFNYNFSINSWSFFADGSNVTVRYSTSIRRPAHFKKQLNSSDPVLSSYSF